MEIQTKENLIKDWIALSIGVKNHILESTEIRYSIEHAANLISQCLEKGNKVLICGNGGSASDSAHMSAELLNQFSLGRTRPLAAIDLTAMNSTITAIGNDSDYRFVFSKQLQALGKKGDVLVAISTSGNSPNIIDAIGIALKKGLKVVFLTSSKFTDEFEKKINKNGSVIKIPSDLTPIIQESHIMVIHILCNLIDYNMVEVNYLDKSTW